MEPGGHEPAALEDQVPLVDIDVGQEEEAALQLNSAQVWGGWFFEAQLPQGAFCGRHALNNLLGEPHEDAASQLCLRQAPSRDAWGGQGRSRS